MKRIVPVLILTLQILCFSALTVSAAITYSVDDGTAENALGLSAGGNVWWANAFTVQAGGEDINTIQIAFQSGTVTAGMPFKVMVYEDPDDDGNPATGPIVLLAVADATIVDPSGGTFQDIPVGPATVSGGFFIAALINHAGGQHPTAMDETTYAGVSWIAGSSAAVIDPNSPFVPAPELGPDLVGNFGLPCNWLIRAVSVAALSPAATTQAATSVGTASATLNGLVNANGDSTTVTFEYGPTAAYGSTVTAAQSPVAGAVDTAVSAGITGLTPGLTYHFRVVAQNGGGTTNGADLTFTTGAIPATTAITRPATAIDLTSATLNGLVNAIGYDTTVTFEYGSTTDYGSTVTAAQSPVSGLATLDVSAGITGLTPGLTYHFRVVARNLMGTTYGADLTFTASPATTFLYFPHTNATGDWQTEIVLINTSTHQFLTGFLKNYSRDGRPAGTESFVLYPHSRLLKLVSDAAAGHVNVGFNTDPGTIQGYVMLYREGVCRSSIPAFTGVNTGDILIPHIASNDRWWTGISLVNTAAETKEITITFNDGRSVVRTLNADEQTFFTIAELFDGQSQPGIKSGVITNAGGIAGLALFGTTAGDQLDGISLSDDTFSTLYYPHVADNPGWWTGIVVYNPDSADCEITLTAYSEAGTVLFVSNDVIPGRENIVRMASQLGLPDATAWFTIEAASPVTGFALFGTRDGNQLAAYPVNGDSGSRKGVFARIEENGWSGIVLVNTEAGEANVILTAYRNDGTPIAVEKIHIDGYARLIGLAENIFSEDISDAGYIAYTSTTNLTGLQLNAGSTGAMLDGLPILFGTE